MTRSLKAHALKINLSKAFLSLSPNSYIFNPSAFYKKPGRLFQCTFFSGNFNAQKIQNGILYIIFSYRIYQDWQQLRLNAMKSKTIYYNSPSFGKVLVPKRHPYFLELIHVGLKNLQRITTKNSVYCKKHCPRPISNPCRRSFPR